MPCLLYYLIKYFNYQYIHEQQSQFNIFKGNNIGVDSIQRSIEVLQCRLYVWFNSTVPKFTEVRHKHAMNIEYVRIKNYDRYHYIIYIVNVLSFYD